MREVNVKQCSVCPQLEPFQATLRTAVEQQLSLMSTSRHYCRSSHNYYQCIFSTKRFHCPYEQKEYPVKIMTE
ncbi:unnamed protein product [Thelazia callipaeda]|uniref:Zf-C3Hc3H domain-containing protein n=1 Tax=Thelazia callipaeda TaxID=103827 RepID=A0A0N5D601_THECL|nr:unnamed protein product [Thelazia callipaeda]